MKLSHSFDKEKSLSEYLVMADIGKPPLKSIPTAWIRCHSSEGIL